MTNKILQAPNRNLERIPTLFRTLAISYPSLAIDTGHRPMLADLAWRSIRKPNQIKFYSHLKSFGRLSVNRAVKYSMDHVYRERFTCEEVKNQIRFLFKKKCFILTRWLPGLCWTAKEPLKSGIIFVLPLQEIPSYLNQLIWSAPYQSWRVF